MIVQVDGSDFKKCLVWRVVGTWYLVQISEIFDTDFTKKKQWYVLKVIKINAGWFCLFNTTFSYNVFFEDYITVVAL